MGDDVRPHPAHTRRHLPLVVERVAPRAHRPWRHPPATTVRTGLHSQLAGRAPGPERGRFGMVDGREDHAFDHQRSFTSNKAEVGTPSPLVTRHTPAPSTCECDSFRNWRAPSTMRLK